MELRKWLTLSLSECGRCWEYSWSPISTELNHVVLCRKCANELKKSNILQEKLGSESLKKKYVRK